MERRNFLKGLFGGVAAGGIILKASDADIAAFADTPGTIIHAAKPDGPMEGVEPGLFVYNYKGEIIGVITDIMRHRDTLDVTTYSDQVTQLIAGPETVDLKVRVRGRVNIKYSEARAYNGRS